MAKNTVRVTALTETTIRQVAQLAKQGRTAKSIAQIIGVSTPTFNSWLRTGRQDLAELERIELDLRNDYRITDEYEREALIVAACGKQFAQLTPHRRLQMELVQAYEGADAQYVGRIIDNITVEATENAEIGMKWLRQRYPDEFGERRHVTTDITISSRDSALEALDEVLGDSVDAARKRLSSGSA